MKKKSISILLSILLVFMMMPIDLANAQSNINLNFELDKDSFAIEENITGIGQVKKGEIPAKGANVTLTIEDNTELSLFKVSQYLTDGNGKFNVKFRLPLSMKPGNYIAKVKALGKETTTEFKIVEKEFIEPEKPIKLEPTPDKDEEKPGKEDLDKNVYEKDIDCGKIKIMKDEEGSVSGKIDIDEKKIQKQIADDKNKKLVIKVDTEEELNKISVNFKPSIIEDIVDSKKDLEVSWNDLTWTFKTDVLKNKDENIELKIEKKDRKIGKEYIQVSSLISLKSNVSEVGEKSTLSIKHDSRDGLNFEKACLYKIDEKGNVVFVGGKLDRNDKSVESEIDSLGEYVVLIYDKTFKDVDTGWAKDAIEVLAARHVVHGVDEENFNPNRNITRAEFCKMVVEALNIETKNASVQFKDVDEDKWYAEFVNIAASLGIVSGYDGKFNPNDTITREAMASIIYRGLKFAGHIDEDISGDLVFADSEEISNWAKDAISYVEEKEIVKGIGNNKFAPKRNATRAEAATIIYRMLKQMGVF